MKTEELLRYRQIYQALRARFGVRFVEFGFRPREEPMPHENPEKGEPLHPFDMRPRPNGPKSAE